MGFIVYWFIKNCKESFAGNALNYRDSILENVRLIFQKKSSQLTSVCCSGTPHNYRRILRAGHICIAILFVKVSEHCVTSKYRDESIGASSTCLLLIITVPLYKT